MKTNIKHLPAIVMAIAVIVTLSSFTMFGAHSYQVFIDKKMIVDQYVKHDMTVPKIAINPESSSEIILKYSECGRTVSGRSLTIKDEQNKILKEWRFEGTTSAFKDPMVMKVKDIADLKSKGQLKLFYASNEFTEGQQVATLTVGKDLTTAGN